jgi:hypothetical protein
MTMATKTKTKRDVRLATIKGKEFADGLRGSRKQHVCDIEVYYDQGGMNFYSGGNRPRCYGVSVRHRVVDLVEGYSSLYLDGKGNPSAVLMPAKAFSASTLAKLAENVRSGQGELLAILGRLYQELQATRPDAQYPDMNDGELLAAMGWTVANA